MALSDYQQIEYIEGVSGAYINTGFIMNRYKMCSAVFTFKHDAVHYIYGVNGNIGGTARNFSFFYSTDIEYRWRLGNTAVAAQAMSPVFAEDTLLTMTQYKSGTRLYCEVTDEDGTPVLTKYFTDPNAGRPTTGYNTFIMGRNNEGTAAGFATGCKLYSIRFYDVSDDSDIFNGIPVREKTGVDPKVGLYDTVTDTVFWSASATNFVAGPDVGGGGGVKIYVKVGGAWTLGDPYIKVNGQWEPADNVYIKTGGNWEPAA